MSDYKKYGTESPFRQFSPVSMTNASQNLPYERENYQRKSIILRLSEKNTRIQLHISLQLSNLMPVKSAGVNIMKITNIELKNLKCFHDDTIDLYIPETSDALPVCILVRANGTGKSTILKSVVAVMTGIDGIFGIFTANEANQPPYACLQKDYDEFIYHFFSFVLSVYPDTKIRIPQGNNNLIEAYQYAIERDNYCPYNKNRNKSFVDGNGITEIPQMKNNLRELSVRF